MVTEEIFEVTITTRELRQLLSALYVQDGDQALYRRLAHLMPQPALVARHIPQMSERLEVLA